MSTGTRFVNETRLGSNYNRTILNLLTVYTILALHTHQVACDVLQCSGYTDGAVCCAWAWSAAQSSAAASGGVLHGLPGDVQQRLCRERFALHLNCIKA